jgi:hypothetical protein
LFADCWEWLAWPETEQRIIKLEHSDSLRLVEFVNQVEAWNPQFELDTHAVQQLTNGHHYALACFSAKFYAARLSIKCQ